MGAMGLLDTDREIRRIDRSNFEACKIGAAFAMSERFFSPPEAIKSQHPPGKALNAGWES
ncbi:MAG: hypothetical protein ACK5RC_01245 [Curvibacter sp.]|jgi:hypothetical protein